MYVFEPGYALHQIGLLQAQAKLVGSALWEAVVAGAGSSAAAAVAGPAEAVAAILAFPPSRYQGLVPQSPTPYYATDYLTLLKSDHANKPKPYLNTDRLSAQWHNDPQKNSPSTTTSCKVSFAVIRLHLPPRWKQEAGSRN